MTQKHRLRGIAAGTAAILAVVLAACDTSSTSATAGGSTSGAPVRIVVGTFPGGSPAAAIAQSEGLFAKAGLDVEFKQLAAGPAILQATATKQVDIGYGDVYAWSNGVLNGFDDVQLIAPSNATLGWLYTSKDSGVKSAQDLVGKKIGLTPTPFPATLVKNWLTSEGVDPSKVEFATVNVGSQAAAIQSNSVAAVFTFDFVTNARVEQAGGVQLADLTQAPGVPATAANASYYANTDFLAKNPGAVQKFVTVVRQAAKAYQDADTTTKAKDVGVFTGVDLNQLSSTIPTLLDDPTWTTLLPGPLDAQATQQWVDLGVTYGSVGKPFTIASHLYKTATEG